QVQAAGHSLVDAPEGADVIVVNTCAFIDAAKEESVDTILEMAEYKKASKGKLVVTGCLAQRYSEDLVRDIPEIDHILGSSDFQSINKVLKKAPPLGPQGKKSRKKLPVVEVTETPEYIYDHETPRVRIGAKHSAYVKIAEGCDRPCAFCIIPKLRGPQRSRTIADIVAEVEQLGSEGVREINLIAQDLTRYGWDKVPDGEKAPEHRADLAKLLRALGKADSAVDWIRLHYTFPSAFDDELIDAIASEPKVVKYIDVPLQHISDPMLKRMRRGHTNRITRDLITKLRARIDDVVIRTTYIVGHPGETAEEFAELCDFVRDSKLDRAGAFTFSIEPGTVSALLPNRVDPEVALERQQTLMEIQRQISRARHEALVGKELVVLVEGESSESEHLLEGRWYGQAPGIDGVTYLSDGQVAPGSLVRARVTQASDYDLAATLELA
ncbi:MAG: 30S ribosomal protein S12 methylthiotransferase RimO, partial [Proteobacteria bacterium]|nr:30S ribosomal protein S12 methylthiotransferase RimO [Pseudomonadota bacterium]